MSIVMIDALVRYHNMDVFHSNVLPRFMTRQVDSRKPYHVHS